MLCFTNNAEPAACNCIRDARFPSYQRASVLTSPLSLFFVTHLTRQKVLRLCVYEYPRKFKISWNLKFRSRDLTRVYSGLLGRRQACASLAEQSGSQLNMIQSHTAPLGPLLEPLLQYSSRLSEQLRLTPRSRAPGPRHRL
jgi:hypothetical protein